MVLAIGNHEVRGGTATSPTNAQFYLRYFAQNGDRTFYSRTFGQNLALFLLDSGHLARQGGKQADWLDAQLATFDKIYSPKRPRYLDGYAQLKATIKPWGTN